MNFSDIASNNELITYLDDVNSRLKDRKYIYHYTVVDRVIDIYKSKKWYLSSAKSMNDRREVENGDKEKWKNLFYASFMSDADESIGMWSMYAQPWEKGVQIAIPVLAVKNG